MTIRASASFSNVNYDLFNTVLECCKKNAEIKYADKQRNNIVGKSVFGTQNQSGINFQIILKEKPTGVEIYDYSKRGLDRKFADNFFNILLPIIGQDVDIKFEDLDECAICKKKFKLGLSRYLPSIGWATHSELCESCYTLLSSHGAGRTMSRSAARRNYTTDSVRKNLELKGVYIKALSREGMVEETPEAYKDVDSVVEVSHSLGIATKVARLVPIGVIKG